MEMMYTHQCLHNHVTVYWSHKMIAIIYHNTGNLPMQLCPPTSINPTRQEQ